MNSSLLIYELLCQYNNGTLISPKRHYTGGNLKTSRQRKYPILDYKITEQYENEAMWKNVSEIARNKGGWWYEFKKLKSYDKMPENLKKKRYSFLSRTLPQYYKKPTRRRLLSLYMWSFDPN